MEQNELEALKVAAVGSKVKFEGERMPYTVQARSDRYLVCTKPFAARHTTIYTIVDLQERVRGTENMLFERGFETREQCERAIERLEGRVLDLGFTTKVSHRNRVPLRVTEIRSL